MMDISISFHGDYIHNIAGQSVIGESVYCSVGVNKTDASFR
jgi:hypothetical protein